MQRAEYQITLCEKICIVIGIIVISLIWVIMYEPFYRPMISQLPPKTLCCYYAQHYHQCMSGKKGCILGPAIEGVIETPVQFVRCEREVDGCSVPDAAGLFLRGYRHKCTECK